MKKGHFEARIVSVYSKSEGDQGILETQIGFQPDSVGARKVYLFENTKYETRFTEVEEFSGD